VLNCSAASERGSYQLPSKQNRKQARRHQEV